MLKLDPSTSRANSKDPAQYDPNTNLDCSNAALSEFNTWFLDIAEALSLLWF
jgi:hypothetical protein